jgi:hypothetical protein
MQRFGHQVELRFIPLDIYLLGVMSRANECHNRNECSLNGQFRVRSGECASAMPISTRLRAPAARLRLATLNVGCRGPSTSKSHTLGLASSSLVPT